MKMKKLILNADDFGLTCGVNEAIIRAHREGVLTSATLMANGPAFEHAVELAKAHPALGVGCHLVLAGGPAISCRDAIPSLVDAAGRLPDSVGLFAARVSSGSIRANEIGIELRAQIEKIRRAGIEPTHLDTHKHTHVHPVVMRALAGVARELSIRRVRNPVESLRDSWTTSSGANDRLKSLAAAATVRVLASGFGAACGQYGLRSPDHFFGLALTGQLSAAALRRLIEALPDGSSEIMLHPGISDAELRRTGSRLQQHRQLELDALIDPGVRQAVAEQAVRLISYRDLN
jgi:chitin disaccharide deacetylase